MGNVLNQAILDFNDPFCSARDLMVMGGNDDCHFFLRTEIEEKIDDPIPDERIDAPGRFIR